VTAAGSPASCGVAVRLGGPVGYRNRFLLAKPHEGKVVKAGDGKPTMTMKGDEKKHTHDVARDAKITLDGKKAKLEDLKNGFHVKVMMDAKHAIMKIEARSKEK
jgi:hypothetical protein